MTPTKDTYIILAHIWFAVWWMQNGWSSLFAIGSSILFVLIASFGYRTNAALLPEGRKE